MRLAIIDGFTNVLGKPANWDDEKNGRCGALHIKAETIAGVAYLRSAWEVDGVEAGMLLAGARVVLGIAGTSHPVVNMGTTDVPDEVPPVLTARLVSQDDASPAVHVEMIFGANKRGVCRVAMNEHSYGSAVKLATDSIMELAKNQGWIA